MDALGDDNPAGKAGSSTSGDATGDEEFGEAEGLQGFQGLTNDQILQHSRPERLENHENTALTASISDMERSFAGELPIRADIGRSVIEAGASRQIDDRSTRSRSQTAISVSPITGAITPLSSHSSLGFTEEELNIAREFTGSTDKTVLKNFLAQQIAQENMANETKEQEMRDAEFARSLQNDSFTQSFPPHPSSAAARFQPSLRETWSTPSQTRQDTPLGPVDPLSEAGELNSEQPPEPHLQSMPGAFFDTDDDLRDYPGEASDLDDDICEIDWNTFSSSVNQHHDPAPYAQGYQQEYNNNTALDLTQYSSPFDTIPHPEFGRTSHPILDMPSRIHGLPIGWENMPQDHGIHHHHHHGFQNQPLQSNDLTTQADSLLESLESNILAGSYGRRHAAMVDNWINDPRKTREDIQNLLENIRPEGETNSSGREPTPEAMRYPLMEHQKVGLTWMKDMETGTNKGGILADEMGLGKTIQALALIVSRKSPDLKHKTTLIVAPVALMKQWEREIRQKLKNSHQLRIYTVHGSKRNTTWDELRSHDVVLTTFGTLSSELRRLEEWEERKKVTPDHPAVKATELPLLGESSHWYRVIVDEAQCIKNRNTRAAVAAGKLKADSRFCLTGTPMMNNVSELQALIQFMRIKPYDDNRKFNTDFVLPLKRHYNPHRDSSLRKLQALLKAILLRRTKESKIDGQSIIQLPPCTQEVVHSIFDDQQQAFYTALENKTALQFNKYMKNGSIGKHYSHVLVLLLRLRQACCHPHLIKDFSGDSEVTDDQLDALARELSAEAVHRIKEIEAFECPVCYDGVENPSIFLPCGHDSCSECLARLSAQTNVNGLAEGVEHAEVRCPACRGPINAQKVTNYAAFKRVHMPEVEAGPVDLLGDEIEDEAGEEVKNDEDSETASEDIDDDSSNMSDFIDDGNTESEGEMLPEDPMDMGNVGVKVDLDDETAKIGKKRKAPKSKKRRSKKVKKEAQKVDKGKAKAHTSLAQVMQAGNRNMRTRQAYLRRLEDDWVPSAKTEKTCEILEGIRAAGEGEKTIIFSQFTSLLDLLEVPIARKGWKYERYDGSMTSTRRNDAIVRFSDDPTCKIMLVSLKAGNAGLNLVAASQVIILDPFWNPYVEDQAVNRTHRIGQLRPVKVHRILVPNTVEDRIVELQEKKKALIQNALDENASRDISRLNTRELAYLFGVGDRPQ